MRWFAIVSGAVRWCEVGYGHLRCVAAVCNGLERLEAVRGGLRWFEVD